MNLLAQVNHMKTLVIIAVLAATLKFLTDGVTLGNNTVSFGHLDPLAYGAFLTPILGAHGFMSTKKTEIFKEEDHAD